jgi:hypothetical protein
MGMKKYILLTAIFFLVIAILVISCKYKDGPLISFRSKDNRIRGAWFLDFGGSITVDGAELLGTTIGTCDSNSTILYFYTIDEIDYVQLCYKDNNVVVSNDKINWSFSDHKKYITFHDSQYQFFFHRSGNSDDTWEIRELRHKYLSIEKNENGHKYTIALTRGAK